MASIANMEYQKVTDYLLKRGFNRTEEIFRQESKHLGADGKPIQQVATSGPKKYLRAFKLLQKWIDNNLDLYKVSHCLLLMRSSHRLTIPTSLSYQSCFGLYSSTRILS